MKKLRLFFAASFLLLLTIAAFAGRNRFTTYGLYAQNGVDTYVLIRSASFVDLTTVNPGGSQCGVTGAGSFDLNTYVTGTGYVPVFSTSAW